MTPSPSNPRPSSFVSDVLKLVGGTTFAQALAILAAPILTRLYAPEAFGMAALFAAITGIITVVSCLRYELAIMLPKKDEEAANLLGLSLLIAAGMSALMVPIIWLGGDRLLELLNAPELAPYLWLSPLAVFLGGVFLALNYWNSRTKRFGRLSLARINASISTTGTQIGAGVGGYPTGGSLIGASILGSAVSNLVLGGQIWRDDRRVFRNSISFEGMKEGLSRHRKFPLIDTLSALMNTISWQLPIFLLSAFFSTSVVGLYALTNRVLHLPMSFIGSSISQVFFQRAAEARAEGRLPYLVENVFKVLVVLGLFPMMMLTLMGKDLFVVIFGQTWSEAGVYAQILGIYTFLWFISSPLSTIYIVLEKQEFGIKYNILNIVSRFLALLIGGLIGNPRISILLFSVSGILVYSYLLQAVLRFSGVPITNAIKLIFDNLKIFAPAGVTIVILKILAIDVIVQVGVSATLISIYYVYVIKTDPLLRTILKRQGDHK
jgi:O-antigen/teichoic acid export membrane protein